MKAKDLKIGDILFFCSDNPIYKVSGLLGVVLESVRMHPRRAFPTLRIKWYNNGNSFTEENCEQYINEWFKDKILTRMKFR